MREIKTTYKDVEIEYSEEDDRWHFMLRGKERTALSLSRAKEEIRKPPPKDKKPFTPTEAYHLDRWSAKPVRLKVTGIADNRYATCVWTTRDGKREKVAVNELYAVTDESTKAIEQIKDCQAGKKKLDQRIEELRKTLPGFVIPKNVE